MTAFTAHLPNLQPGSAVDTGLRGPMPARPTQTASYSVPVGQVAALLPRFLQTAPRGHRPCASLALCLHQTWAEDLHLRAVKHARHTRPCGRRASTSGLENCSAVSHKRPQPSSSSLNHCRTRQPDRRIRRHRVRFPLFQMASDTPKRRRRARRRACRDVSKGACRGSDDVLRPFGAENYHVARLGSRAFKIGAIRSSRLGLAEEDRIDRRSFESTGRDRSLRVRRARPRRDGHRARRRSTASEGAGVDSGRRGLGRGSIFCVRCEYTLQKEGGTLRIGARSRLMRSGTAKRGA